MPDAESSTADLNLSLLENECKMLEQKRNDLYEFTKKTMI